MKKLIFFELNEVPWFIIHDFIKKNPQSALAFLTKHSFQAETFTEDINPLSPWITWPSVHRGVADQLHGILEFGQPLADVNLKYPPIWDILAAHGKKIGIFGSLHSYPLPTETQNYPFYLPDSFALDPQCKPEVLKIFQRFNLSMSRLSGRNVASQVNWKQGLELLQYHQALGLKYKTFFDLGAQLLHEKFNSARKSRRRVYQGSVGFDIFLKQLRQTQPDFCTFFTNHVASAMHRYWIAAYPEHYKEKQYDRAWIKNYRHEIDFAMKKADEMLNCLIQFIQKKPEYRLLIMSSMGQEAVVHEPIKTQVYLDNTALFLTRLGLPEGAAVQLPCMLPRVNFKVDAEYITLFRQKLSALMIGSKPLNVIEGKDGFFRLKFGIPNIAEESVSLEGVIYPFAHLGLKNTVIEDKSASCAYHIPQGSLLYYCQGKPSERVFPQKISTLAIAPSILEFFNLKSAQYMQAPLPELVF